jgi:hypothetical protein
MQPLDPVIAEALRKRSQANRERMASTNFTKTWALQGKNAIVEPGRDVVIRLAPRWDYANSMFLDPSTGTRVPNPAYDTRLLKYVEALEHWWDGADGKRTREWCPQTIDLFTKPGAPCACPVGVSSAALLSGTAVDKEIGKGIRARRVFIWNAVVGDPKDPTGLRRRVNEQGLADFRPISLPERMFYDIADIMTGGDKSQFGRGDITHPAKGYDLILRRPAGPGGGPWTVQVATESSRLYQPEQAAAFKGWVNRLVDLEDMIRKETKDAAGIFRAYYGRDPEPGELGVAEPPEEAPSGVPVGVPVAPQGGPEPSAEPPQAPDDEFMPPPAQARPSARPAPRAPRR